MRYSIRRFSRDRSSGSTGERIGAATKVIGLGTAATLGTGAAIGKGVSAYLGNKSRGLNYDLFDSFMNKGLPEANNRLLETGAKKAALEGSQGLANHMVKRAGKGALIAGGIGLGGMLAQRYFRNKKNQRSFSTLGKLLRRGLAGATKSPGAAAGAVAGAGGSVVGTAIHPGLAALPWVSGSTAVGQTLNKTLLPRKWRLGLEKTSRQMRVNPENYEAAGLPVPKASRVAYNLERWVDKSRVGRFFNPRLKILQESKAAKKLKKTTEKVHKQIGNVSSGLQRGLSEFPTTGMAVTHL